MVTETVLIALCLIYLSICLGVYLKFCQYKVKNNKIVYSLISPIMLNVLAASIAWDYIKLKEEEEQTVFSVMDKMTFMVQLIKLNIQWFPALVGFFAVALVNQEKLDVQSNKDGYQDFSRKSYELYDDCMSYAS